MFTFTSCCFVVTQSNNYDDHNKVFFPRWILLLFSYAVDLLSRACILQMRSEKGKKQMYV